MKMKILLLITLPPPLHGVTVMNSQMANSAVLQEVFEISILPISYNQDIATLGSFRIRKFLTYIKLIILLVKNMLFFRPKAVYFPLALHGINFYRDAIFVFIVKFFRKKLILQLNGVGIEEQIKGPLSKFVYRQVFKGTYAIILSESLLDDLNKIAGIIKKTYAVHLGIPDSKVQHKCKTLQKHITFINVSNITPLKGQIYILRAAQRLIDQNYNSFKIILVGQIQDRAYFTELNAMIRQTHLENYVHFKGPLFGEERDREFANADVFVFPTLREAFGLVAIEAMRERMPVIASDVGSMREILGNESGFVYPPQDDKKLSEHMIQFLKNRELIRIMGANAFKTFQDKFAFEKFEAKTRDVFLDILRD